MATLQSKHLILQPLTILDKEAFYSLYRQINLITDNETPLEFTRRIISACNIIWAIRLKNNAADIIGDCALHHFDRQKGEIQIGGSLLPLHQRKGYMTEAFQLVQNYAQTYFKVKHLLGVTTIDNYAAVSLAEKSGFVKHSVVNETIILKKSL